MKIKSTPLGGCIRLFLKNFFSNFRSHIKDSKWGRKCIFINCTSCNRSPQQIPFQFANGKLPLSRCRAFWARSHIVYWLLPEFQSSQGNSIEFCRSITLMTEKAIPAAGFYVLHSKLRLIYPMPKYKKNYTRLDVKTVGF